MSEHRESDVDFIDAVRGVLQNGGRTTDKFNAAQVCHYFGLELGEMAVRIQAIAEGSLTPESGKRLRAMASLLSDWGEEFDQGKHEGDILRCNHADLIASQFRTQWLTMAGTFSTSSDAQAAFRHGIFGMVDDPKTLVDFEPYTDKTPRG